MTAQTAGQRDDPGSIREEFRPAWPALLPATAVVTAVYVYFLIFAQFGFLKMLQASAGTALLLKPLMGVMGVGGVAGSVLAARGYTEARARGLLSGALVLAGAGCGLVLLATTPAALATVAALTGLGTGGATVVLGASLRRVVGTERLGCCLGVGTGTAYGFCNLPWVWQADWRTQAVIGGGAALLGLIAGRYLRLQAPSGKLPPGDYGAPGIALWVVIFLALVWFDSAAFYVVQHTPALANATWGGSVQLCGNAATHLATAVLAGYALDRGGLGRTVVVATALLLAAAWLITRSEHSGASGALLYVAAASIYSTALVFYPARSGRAAVPALVYAIAGWGGSALGIGMAENRHMIPGWFWAVAGGAVAAGLTVRAAIRRRGQTGTDE